MTAVPLITPGHAAYTRAMAPYLGAMQDLAREAALHQAYTVTGGRVPRVGAVGQAVERLGEVIHTAQTTADMAARAETLKAADRLARAGSVAPPGVVAAVSPAGPVLARVPYTEAVADMMAREPRLARGWEAVAKAYNEEHVFALARSSEASVTARVQKAMTAALHKGTTVSGAVKSIRGLVAAVGEDMSDWTRAYAEMAFRTNVTTAYSAGRFQQMADPAVQVAIGALRYTAVMDSETRPNHRAMDGLIAAADWPGWQKVAPPNGFACRCGLDFVSWPELKRRHLVLPGGGVRAPSIPRGAHPDPGFPHAGRPDIAIYGGLV